jgi:hypothetical protein
MSNIPGLYEVNTATRRIITIGMDDPLATQLALDLRDAVSLLTDRAMPDEPDFQSSADRLDDFREQLERALMHNGTD